MSPKYTDFGFERIPSSAKQHRVGAVFDSVAERYDMMNDLMSLGIHRLWKRFTVNLCGVRDGHLVLDLAGGTGDLAVQFARQVGDTGQVILADINRSMLDAGRDRLTDAGELGRVNFVQANAEHLPFASDSFDRVCIAFGLRNVTDKMAALESMYRVLRPGGSVAILEFSKLSLEALRPLYDAYSFKVLPWLGDVVANDAQAYRYLAESIRMHPDQGSLLAMMERGGFERCSFHNLAAGVVALHRGYKF